MIEPEDWRSVAEQKESYCTVIKAKWKRQLKVHEERPTLVASLHQFDILLL